MLKVVAVLALASIALAQNPWGPPQEVPDTPKEGCYDMNDSSGDKIAGAESKNNGNKIEVDFEPGGGADDTLLYDATDEEYDRTNEDTTIKFTLQEGGTAREGPFDWAEYDENGNQIDSGTMDNFDENC